MDQNVITELERTLPPAFSRSEVARLFPGMISARRLEALDAAGEGPPQVRMGKKVGYLRRPFLEWMCSRVGMAAAPGGAQ
jgi:hypothetical protein